MMYHMREISWLIITECADVQRYTHFLETTELPSSRCDSA